MITCEFDEWGQPYVRCEIILPRLDISYQIRFLVDTGAYKTCVHAWDAGRMSIPFDLLQDRRESFGIGGSSLYFNENAYLIFNDGNLTRVYRVELLIAEPGGNVAEGFPSLLGRDLLHNWEMTYSPMRDRLEFEVLSAYLTLENE